MSRGFMDWKDKVCVITGASSGFGRDIALMAAAKGASVVALARRAEKLKSLIGDLEGAGHSFVVCDVSKLEDIRAAVQEISSRHGQVDVLVNNAGVKTAGALSRATSEDMEKVIRTNLLSVIWCTREFLPLLERAPLTSRTPVVVNVASMAGRIAIPRSGDYAASKFGVVGFTEAAAPDLAPRGIKVMMVNPGLADTEGFPMDDVRSNPLTAWTVMDSKRVARAAVQGIERGSFEVRVQWWMHPLYFAAVAAGPLRRAVTQRLAGMFGREGGSF